MTNILDNTTKLALTKFMRFLLVMSLVFSMILNIPVFATSAPADNFYGLFNLMYTAEISEPEGLPAYDELVSYLQDSEKDPANYQGDKTENEYAVMSATWELYNRLYKAFPSKTDYTKYRQDLIDGVSVNGDNGEPSAKNQSDNGVKFYDSLKRTYSSAVSTSTMLKTVDGLFGTDKFDPSASIVAPLLSGFYEFVNIAFSFCSAIFMWGLLMQFGFDCLYIGVDFSRAFLTKYDESLESQGVLGNVKGQFKKGLPVISAEAYEIARGHGAGTGSGNDSAIGNNKVLKYVKMRAGVVILGGVFLVMVSGGWWTTFIGVTSRIVINVFTYVLDFFGLLN